MYQPPSHPRKEERDFRTALFFLQERGNVLLETPKGKIKSRLLKAMIPEEQKRQRHARFRDLPYFGVYIRMEETARLAHLEKLLSPQNHFFPETVLTIRLLRHFLTEAEKETAEDPRLFHQESLQKALRETLRILNARGNGKILSPRKATPRELYQIAQTKLAHERALAKAFLTEVEKGKDPAFQGEVYSFKKVLEPIVLSFIEKVLVPKKVFLLIDDAHHLSTMETRHLNDFVLASSGSPLSFKIAYEKGRYKSLSTSDKKRCVTTQSAHFLSLRTPSFYRPRPKP